MSLVRIKDSELPKYTAYLPELLQKTDEMVESYKQLTKTMGQMKDAYVLEVLKCFKWEGPAGTNSKVQREYEPNQLQMIERECSKSPVFKCVVPIWMEREARQKGYPQTRPVCLCCQSQLIFKPVVGWVTLQEYSQICNVGDARSTWAERVKIWQDSKILEGELK